MSAKEVYAQKMLANRFSVDFSAGTSKILYPLSDNFSSIYFKSPFVELGGRIMLNNRFGLKPSFGYYHFEFKNSTFDLKDTNLISNSNYFKTTIDAVTNLSAIFGVDSKASRFGFLLNTGLGFSILKSDKSLKFTVWTDDYSDIMINVHLGVSGLYKLNEHSVLTMNLGGISHLSQTFAFDMNSSAKRQGFDGVLLYSGLGYTWYFGKQPVHYDWIKK